MKSNTIRLVFPLFVGGMAAMANYAYVANQFDEEEFIAFDRAVSPNTEITARDITSVSIPNRYAANWQGTFLRWNEQKLIIGRRPNQEFQKGDLAVVQSFLSNPLEPEPGNAAFQIDLSTLDKSVTKTIQASDMIRFVVRDKAGEPFTTDPLKVLAIVPKIANGEHVGDKFFIEDRIGSEVAVKLSVGDLQIVSVVTTE